MPSADDVGPAPVRYPRRAVDLYAELTGIVSVLETRGIEYALCGGLALAIHGAPRATQDIAT